MLVIQSISSGLTLLNLDSSYRFFVTGVVLLLAVGVDSLARRSRTTHGPRLSGRGPGVAGDTGSMVRTYVCPGPRR